MFTKFYDMNSGGKRKEKYKIIFIEAPEEVAKVVFYNRFGHNPDRITCTCCGEDYSIYEYDDLLAGTEYYKKTAALSDFLHRDDVLVICQEDISDSDKAGEVPSQGYVWID